MRVVALINLLLLQLVAGMAFAQHEPAQKACAADATTGWAATSKAGEALELGNELVARGETNAALTAYAESEERANASGETQLSLFAGANSAHNCD